MTSSKDGGDGDHKTVNVTIDETLGLTDQIDANVSRKRQASHEAMKAESNGSSAVAAVLSVNPAMTSPGLTASVGDTNTAITGEGAGQLPINGVATAVAGLANDVHDSMEVQANTTPQQVAPSDFTTAFGTPVPQGDQVEVDVKSSAVSADVPSTLPLNDVLDRDAVGTVNIQSRYLDRNSISSDAPTEEDVLARKPYASALVDVIVESQSSGSPGQASEAVVVNLFGAWGVGKTSLWLQMKSRFNHHKWLAVEYNAWREQDVEPVWWSLLEAMHRECNQARRICVCRWAYLKVRTFLWRIGGWRVLVHPWIFVPFSLLAVWWLGTKLVEVPRFPETVQTIGKVVAAIVLVASSVSGLLSANNAKAAQSFERSRANPMGAVRARFQFLADGVGKPIVVFVDDLDRCGQARVVSVLETVQTLFSHPNVYYVVAADRRWISRCFSVVHKELEAGVSRSGQTLGDQFVAKMFQVSAPVPPMSRERQGELARSLWADASPVGTLSAANSNATQEETPADSEHRLRRLLPLFDNNPRQHKRLSNNYRVYREYAKAIPLDLDESTANLLALWVIIVAQWPGLAEALVEEPALLGRLRTDHEAVHTNDAWSQWKALLRNPRVRAALSTNVLNLGFDLTPAFLRCLGGEQLGDLQSMA